MGIGFRIREAREALGYRQHELAKLIGVTASAVTNYEQDYSFPKEEILYRLIDTLQVDANYLFQDCLQRPASEWDLSIEEQALIRKYRARDDRRRNGAGQLFDLLLDTSQAADLPRRAKRTRQP